MGLQFLLIWLYCFTGASGKEAVVNVPAADTTGTETVLYIFTGSDWCSNCRRFDKNVLHDSLFISGMGSRKIRIEILDFPQRRKLSEETIKYNRAMSEKLGFQNIFPTIILASGPSAAKYRTIFYRNEKAPEFRDIVLDELKRLHE